MWRQPRNHYPSPPFHLLFTRGSDSRDCVARPLSKLFSRSSPLFARPSYLNSCSISFLHGLSSPNLTFVPPFVSSSRMSRAPSNSIFVALSVSSPCTSQVPPNLTLTPCPSSLRTRVGFPSTRFSVPCPSPLCAWVGLLPTQFLFTILCYKYLSVKL